MEERYSLKKPESHKTRKRVGRGTGSGHGKTSCRGQKGQLSRSGAKHRPWFEGGQMPLQRRVPKRGFVGKFKEEYQIVNIASVLKIDAPEINPAALAERGMIKRADAPVKILGNGDVSRSVKIIADAFSSTAREKVEKAGGSVQIRKRPLPEPAKALKEE